jgi:hypothetical protein
MHKTCTCSCHEQDLINITEEQAERVFSVLERIYKGYRNNIYMIVSTGHIKKLLKFAQVPFDESLFYHDNENLIVILRGTFSKLDINLQAHPVNRDPTSVIGFEFKRLCEQALEEAITNMDKTHRIFPKTYKKLVRSIKKSRGLMRVQVKTAITRYLDPINVKQIESVVSLYTKHRQYLYTKLKNLGYIEKILSERNYRKFFCIFSDERNQTILLSVIKPDTPRVGV